MTVILVLLCLAIAGRELYLAFERRRTPGAPEIADIRTQLRALKGTRDELETFRASQQDRLDRLTADQDRDREALAETDARIRSLITQINDRLVPDVSDRLKRQREAADEQREAVDRLSTEVAGLRAHLVGRLDGAVAASLGADPADLVAGALTVVPAGARPALTGPYERFAEHHGLRVELTDRDRYYLSGRSPRGLESDFLDLVAAIRENCTETTGKALTLLGALRDTDRGGALVGPLVIVRTPESLVCGVLPLAELLRPEAARLLDDPAGTAARLRRLPRGRFCEAP
ncbi:hypothetical protein [Actinomadura madurae]|uniref:hypothetical protein n=1 Tax=Actinomadura madurae TaxID=1993 RepID=UPI0020D2620E|nr:hypothetical protein [Actinomadura madurae]MCP9952474.1 hypothetical protein [Actinomadura madurae]MCP9981706.1 hypothetical protein [Actinomadura madurae]MCQ0006778.1 hypothetical protein [Actinomadura madurae]MCQ0017914.1 hypothetical protein [Actinomadura madurae]